MFQFNTNMQFLFKFFSFFLFWKSLLFLIILKIINILIMILQNVCFVIVAFQCKNLKNKTQKKINDKLLSNLHARSNNNVFIFVSLFINFFTKTIYNWSTSVNKQQNRINFYILWWFLSGSLIYDDSPVMNVFFIYKEKSA